MERYDIAIIGTGPAGVSAAITAKVRGKRLILFGAKAMSDKVEMMDDEFELDEDDEELDAPEDEGFDIRTLQLPENGEDNE